MRSRWIGSALVIDAPAKLNLSLSVLGRRADGYHELETVMVSIGLYDTLIFEPAEEGVSLTCEGAGRDLPVDGSNLVLRAANLLRSRAKVASGAKIRLTKRIPMQAGMGGGSSDAAATLTGLNNFWKLGLSSEDLHAAAAELGSDVNFFLHSPLLAVCRGRGEVIEPRELKGPLWFVVAKPQSGLSTAAVFRQLDLTDCGKGDSAEMLQACARGKTGQIARLLANELERPSRELSPDLSGLLERLRLSGVCGFRMTGSGSACYGVAGHREQATRAARRLRQQGERNVLIVRTAV